MLTKFNAILKETINGIKAERQAGSDSMFHITIFSSLLNMLVTVYQWKCRIWYFCHFNACWKSLRIEKESSGANTWSLFWTLHSGVIPCVRAKCWMNQNYWTNMISSPDVCYSSYVFLSKWSLVHVKAAVLQNILKKSLVTIFFKIYLQIYNFYNNC